MSNNRTFERTPQVSNTFTPIPAGEYQAVVSRATFETPKSGEGRYIKVAFRIQGPQYANRLVFQNFMVEHANPKAVETSLSMLDGLMLSGGLKHMSTLDDLEGLKLKILVTIREQENYAAQNVVRGYKAL